MIKIGFFWTPHIAKKVLEDLFRDSNFQISFVLTWLDKHVWRSQILTPNPVKEFAILNNLQVIQPEKFKWNQTLFEQLQKYECDYFVVVAFWRILPNEILKMPKKLCVNVHASILPLYRWASPIQSALINWDEYSWVTIMKMSEWMDEGDIIDMEKLNINKFDTSETLFNRFEDISWAFLIKTLKAHYEWNRWLIPQEISAATYCKKITKEDGLLNFSLSAEKLFYLWRGLTPWPWIYTIYSEKKLIITKCDYINENFEGEIWEVIKWDYWIWIKCSRWALVLKEVKLEWKTNALINDFINWKRDFVGSRL